MVAQNAALYRPCVSDRGPVDKFGTYMYDRGLAYVARTGGSRYHRGTDVPVAQGTPLYGSGTGRVVRIAQTQRVGYIWIVAVDYPMAGGGVVRVETQHMSRIDVSVGQEVTTRTRLGLSGGKRGTLGAGNSLGPHVHIQVYANGALVNPDDYLNSRSALGPDGGGSSASQEGPLMALSEQQQTDLFLRVEATALAVADIQKRVRGEKPDVDMLQDILGHVANAEGVVIDYDLLAQKLAPLIKFPTKVTLPEGTLS